MIEFKLPFPPSVNSYKKVGRIVKTKTGKLYQQRVDSNETKTFYYQVYMLTKQKALTASFTEQDRLSVEVILYPPNNKFDIDNPIKVLFDSLTKAKVWHDDRQIDRLLITKEPAQPTDPKVIVTITRK